MDRRILKPKARQNRHHHHSRKSDDDDNFATSTPCGSGVKRKHEDWNETPIKRSKYSNEPSSKAPLKYSANDRLAKYRKTLDQKKHQLVKVHKVLQDNAELKLPSRITSKDASVTTSSSLLQRLPEKVVDSQVILESIHFSNSDNFDRHDNQSVIHHCEFKDSEDMEWSPVDEEEIAADIRKLRSTVRAHPSALYLKLSSEDPTFSKSLMADDPLYVIVDTNIFISHLNLIRDISRLYQKLKVKPIIYVPWMVLQELDFFKDGRSGSANIQTAAKHAVSFINDMLTRKDKALKGQTVHEALTHDFSNPNADDSILFCCLKLQRNQSKIILLSNDQNLRSKVMVHSIEACSTKTIMKALNDVKKLSDTSNLDNSEVQSTNSDAIKHAELTVSEKVADIFARACSEIIKGELEKAYGETAYKMITKPPWTIEECLTYIKRFWMPVFSLIITQKQCLKTVDDLLDYIKTNKDMIQSSENGTEEFVKLTLSLCVYFKNCLSPYESLMKMCISEIQKIIQ